jgi:hypothetical protein
LITRLAIVPKLAMIPKLAMVVISYNSFGKALAQGNVCRGHTATGIWVAPPELWAARFFGRKQVTGSALKKRGNQITG